MSTAVHLKKREKFLELLRQEGLIAVVCRRMNISRNSPYDWARKSETFAAQFAEARQEGHEVLADYLERSLTTRATEGVEEDIYYQGKKIGSQKRYSDVAAIVMLKSLRPHRFVEQLVGVNVSGQQMSIKIMSFSVPAPIPLAGPGAGDSTSHDERPPSLNVTAASVEASLQS